MRKLIFVFLFLAASLAVSAQCQPGEVYKTVEAEDVPAILEKCAATKLRHNNPNDEESSPVFISADHLVLFYVYSNEATGKFDFVAIQSKETYVGR